MEQEQQPFVSATPALSRVSIYQAHHDRVDVYYHEMNFTKALKGYTSLARVNDTFSQYRLAFMHFYGLGIPKDIREAHAWSLLASEGGEHEEKQSHIVFQHFHERARSAIPDSDLAAVREYAGDYISNYGNPGFALKSSGMIQLAKRRCAGSFLGATCSYTISLLESNCDFSPETFHRIGVWYTAPMA